MKSKETVKIFPGAQVLGDAELGENVSVWHGAVIRCDVAPIKIGNNSNVQDNCVLHATKDIPLIIGEGVSIGHGAVAHGCTIGDNVLIGMNATVLDGAHIGKNSIVGAGAVVGEGKEFPEGSLIVGIPAKAVKQLTEDQIQHIKNNANTYVELSQKYDD
jgi:carbonic anhydrase/acetyltransferase-like protein (isoleucine patch superfamily)